MGRRYDVAVMSNGGSEDIDEIAVTSKTLQSQIKGIDGIRAFICFMTEGQEAAMQHENLTALCLLIRVTRDHICPICSGDFPPKLNIRLKFVVV